MKIRKTAALSLGTFMILSNGVPVYADSNPSYIDMAHNYYKNVEDTIDTVSNVVQNSLSTIEIETPEPVEEVSYTYVEEPVYYTVVEAVSEPVSMTVQETAPIIEENTAVDTSALQAAYDNALVNYNAALAEYEAASQLIETTKEVEVEVVEETVDEDGNPVTVTRTEIQTVTETAYAGDVETTRYNLDMAKAALDAAANELNSVQILPVVEKAENTVEVEEIVTETVQNAADENKCGDNLTWAVNDGVLTISGTGDMYDYTGGGPWSEMDVTTVVIEEGVTSIGTGAFWASEMTEISLPSTLTRIEQYAFHTLSQLTSIVIPDNVTYIGESTFEDCSQLASVKLPNKLETISPCTFNECVSLASITLPNSIKRIGERSFVNCRVLTSLVIPGSVTEIGIYAFDGCDSLTNVTIENGVQKIGDSAFENCEKLTSINIPDSVTTLGGFVFNCCESLQSIVIPDSVTEIGDGLFLYCSALKEVTLSAKAVIGSQMFDQCINLESITIPEGVKIIPLSAFDNCNNLKQVILPESLEKIGIGAFENCHSLEKLVIPKGVNEIGTNAFNGDGNLTLYVYKDSYAAEYVETNNIPYEIIDTAVLESKYTLSLDGSIGVDFLMSFTDSVLKDTGAKVEFKVADETISYLIQEAPIDGKFRKFTANVASGQMTTPIEANVILSNGTNIYSKTCTVKDCCDTILNDQTADNKLKRLALDMLVYGGYSQIQFNYNIDDLAYEGQNIDVSDVTPERVARYAAEKTGSADGLKYVGSTISLESLTTIKHYFKLEGKYDISEYIFIMDDQELVPVANGNLYYVKIADIPADQLDTVYTVNVGGFTIEYRALSYVYAQLKKDSSNSALSNVCRAFYKYFAASKTYLG